MSHLFLLSLLLSRLSTFNIFHTFFSCLYRWLETSKCLLGKGMRSPEKALKTITALQMKLKGEKVFLVMLNQVSPIKRYHNYFKNSKKFSKPITMYRRSHNFNVWELRYEIGWTFNSILGFHYITFTIYKFVLKLMGWFLYDRDLRHE